MGSAPMDRQALLAEIALAVARLRPHVRKTPVERSRALEAGGSRVYLKLENVQHTGSFKLRGAFNKLLSLTAEQRARGVVAASSGNHGVAVAWAAEALGMRADVFVPESTSPTKIAAIRQLGSVVTQFGTDSLDAEVRAREVAASRGCEYVSPYNDVAVIAGQGTLGVELQGQLPSLDTVFVAVGGGGLIAGVAAAVKGKWPAARVVGCLPEASPVMARSIAAGHIVEMISRPTLSDGTAGGIEPGSMTFPLCRALVDDWVTVSEDEIAMGMRHCLTAEHTLVEGAAGVAIAGFRRYAMKAGAVSAIVVCGSNVTSDVLRAVLQERTTAGSVGGSRPQA
ncbi:MAG: L-threonine dehydratase catabolic TdcB [Gemmatimonadaceae bacterium]|nr:L-threonine dehydratase catabolic TdcB [Gemmatimonadaceae bacterium]